MGKAFLVPSVCTTQKDLGTTETVCTSRAIVIVVVRLEEGRVRARKRERERGGGGGRARAGRSVLLSCAYPGKFVVNSWNSETVRMETRSREWLDPDVGEISKKHYKRTEGKIGTGNSRPPNDLHHTCVGRLAIDRSIRYLALHSLQSSTLEG